MYLRAGDRGKALENYQKAIDVCGNKFEELKQVARDRIERGPKYDVSTK